MKSARPSPFQSASSCTKVPSSDWPGVNVPSAVVDRTATRASATAPFAPSARTVTNPRGGRLAGAVYTPPAVIVPTATPGCGTTENVAGELGVNVTVPPVATVGCAGERCSCARGATVAFAMKTPAVVAA